MKFDTKWHIMEFLWLLVKKATIHSLSLCWLTVHITRLSYECHGTQAEGEPRLSLHLCSNRYVSKVCSSFCVLLRVKMQRSLEQRYAIKFCAKLGKSGSKTLQLLRTAYGDAVLSSAQVFRWHKAFKDGRESNEDEECAGRPSASRNENNVARVKAVLDRDWRLNVRFNRRGGRTTQNGRPPNHYGRSAHEKNLCETVPEEFVWCMGIFGSK